jgi:ATP-dependent protease ClpP protease subunit
MKYLIFIVLLSASLANAREVILTATNTVVFNQEFTAATVDMAIASLLIKRIKRAVTPVGSPVYLYLDSPGGDVDASSTLVRAIKTIPGVDVLCQNCASAAGYVLATAQHRLVTPDSRILMHEMYLPRVTAADLKDTKQIKEFIKKSDEFNRRIYSVIGISKKEYEDHIIGKRWIVDGEDIVTLHLADEMVTISCDTYIQLMGACQ